jgi:spermidine synthase
MLDRPRELYETPLAEERTVLRRFNILFVLFFLSGFCGLLYQVVWLRNAFAAFGVVTPVLSVVVSVFMLGLALGSWLGGRWVGPVTEKTKLSPMIFYGLIELVIGSGAFIVPLLFQTGERYLLGLGEMDSTRYLAVSALLICLSILPWCVAMGATFPLVMAYIKQRQKLEDSSFSFLYLANVIGAMFGASFTALVLIELLGFARTLFVAAFCNLVIAAASFWLSRNSPNKHMSVLPTAYKVTLDTTHGQVLIKLALFATGFTSMAMEVVWTRAFTPVMKTTIYAFALLLTVYLLATWIGSYVYRKNLGKNRTWTMAFIGPWLAFTVLLPLILADPRLNPNNFLVLLSIFPFSSLLGYLTPKLIDEYCMGDPDLGGRAYAINIVGCILGPLFAGYLILPHLGVKWSLILLAVPFIIYAICNFRILIHRRVLALVSLAPVVLAVFVSRTYEDGIFYTNAVVRRDHTATVVSAGEDMRKKLLVNGIGMTGLTPITKIMAHLPLSTLSNPPESALVICFGMGTTFRSLMSWRIQTTAVELVPSVREAFGYYFADAEELFGNPKSRVVIDDGRRFLKRSRASFDVVTLDPPPPVEAAGSSLLYSTEFYESVKARLRPGGILQQWFPYGEAKILHGVAGAIANSFPHVRVYRSIEDWGYHFLASTQPFETLTKEQMLSRMPENAKRDLMEWYPGKTPDDIVTQILAREISMDHVLGPEEHFFVTDDKPINEYYMLRRQLDYSRQTFHAMVEGARIASKRLWGHEQ